MARGIGDEDDVDDEDGNLQRLLCAGMTKQVSNLFMFPFLPSSLILFHSCTFHADRTLHSAMLEY